MTTRLLILLLLVSGACAPPTAKRPMASSNSAELKEKLAVLDAMQRNKTEWIEVDSCAVDNAPNESHESKLAPEDCAGEPSQCLANCDTGNGEACWALGILIQQTGEVASTVSEALFNKSCRLGIASGCTNAAATRMYREGGKASPCDERSFEYSCKQTDPWGCMMYGRVLAERDDVSAARVALDRACEVSDDKNGEACTNAKAMKSQV